MMMNPNIDIIANMIFLEWRWNKNIKTNIPSIDSVISASWAMRVPERKEYIETKKLFALYKILIQLPHEKNIDIFLSVVDNYGDMGFLAELLLMFDREQKDFYTFHIWTDEIHTLSLFLENNKDILPEYHIFDASIFPQDSHIHCILSLFTASLYHTIVFLFDHLFYELIIFHLMNDGVVFMNLNTYNPLLREKLLK